MILKIEEFQQRIVENIETFNYELKNKCFTPSNYHFFEKHKDEDKRLNEHTNSWDIMGATLVGDLPSNKQYGADGFRLSSGQYIEMEYKISGKKQNSIWQTSLGTLYTGIANIKNKTTSLRSGFAASFEIQNNLQSKNRLTNLFIFDETLQQFVSGFELDGPAVIRYLAKSNGSKKGMKLSYFIKEGTEIVDLKVPSYGSYKKWEEMLRETVQVLQRGAYRVDN